MRKSSKKQSEAVVPRSLAMLMAKETLDGDYTILRLVAALPGQKKGSWGHWAVIMLAWIESGFKGKPPFTVFAKGNSKLPFSAFSTSPVVNCPGAGACISFCYSLTSWQYPAAFFRQLQNSLLARNPLGQEILKAAFLKLPKGTLRLYVDGDFHDVANVFFWMELIASRPDINAYGYSKSWLELIQAQLKGIKWPTNYQLNLSSGSAHDNGLKAIVAQLPIVRGEFIAIRVGKEHISNRAYQGPEKAGFPAYQKAVLAAALEQGYGKVWVCKGKCGACLPNGEHACGSVRFKNVKIAIGVH